MLPVAGFQFTGIASCSVHAVETTASRDYSILAFRDYRLEIQATTAGGAGELEPGDILTKLGLKIKKQVNRG